MAVPKKGLLQTHYTVTVTYSQNRLHIVAVIKTATRKTVSIAWFFCSATIDLAPISMMSLQMLRLRAEYNPSLRPTNQLLRKHLSIPLLLLL